MQRPLELAMAQILQQKPLTIHFGRIWLPCNKSGRLGQLSCCWCDAFAFCRLMKGHS